MTDIFNTENQIKSTGHFNNDALSGEASPREGAALVSGQTVTGELVSIKGNEVKIRVNDTLINAKMDRNINLEVGKNILFEVKSNLNQLLLSPLQTNVAVDVNIMRALTMASLPINESSINMTKQLMDVGLPIEKNFLSNVYKEINTYKDADISDIVSLHKINLPVNGGNIEQMSAYRNLSYQLQDGYTDISNSMQDIFKEDLDNNNYKNLFSLVDTIGKLIVEDELGLEENNDLSSNVNLLQDGEEISLSNQGVRQNEIGDEITTNIINNNQNGTIEQAAEQNTGLGVELGLSSEADVSLQLLNINDKLLAVLDKMGIEIGTDSEAWSDSNNFSIGDKEATYIENTKAESRQIATGFNFDKLDSLINKYDVDNIKEFTSNLTDALKLLIAEKEVLEASDSEGVDIKNIDTILKNGFEKLVGKLKDNWSIEPEKLNDENAVLDLYKKLSSQLKELSSSLENLGKDNSEAFKAVNNMTQNIDFLEQINQAYTYVQLPLKFQDSEACGDLYVYTNKKNLASKGGEISALLHLDMEHLGPVDIYVAMRNENVNTHFYVADESMLDFLSENIDILTKRLNKKGYNIEANFQLKSSEELKSGGVDKLLQNEPKILCGKYAFDVRT